ncbi:MAG: YhdP family protein [Betaproteobacteria bacterium]
MLRGAWLLLRVSIIVFALMLLLVRLVVFPRLEQNRDELSRLLSSQIGQPVEIGALVTGWDGWNPRVDVRDLRVLDRAGGVASVTLPDVRLVVAWTSLPTLSLRLKELTISGAQFAIRRDKTGMLHLAGMTIDPAVTQDDRSLAEWLLRQPRIVVHGAQLVWRDERAGASDLLLSQVEVLLQNRLGRHRFGLKGAPPDALAAPLDLRGELSGDSLADWRTLAGRVYARLDYADIAAWREWLPMTVPIRSGKGALRVWFEIAKGELRDVTADVVLTDVQARLASELPELQLARLEGRLGWSDDGKQSRFYTQRLSFEEKNGVRFEPTDLKVAMRAGEHGIESGRVEFARLDLLPLRELAVALPLPAPWRDALARFSPSGVLENGDLQWRGDLDTVRTISGSGRFVALSIAAYDSFPGIAGLSGSIDASAEGGTVRFDSRGVVLDLRHALGERIGLDSALGTVRWHNESDGVRFDVDQIAFSNRDIAGSAKGSFTTVSGQRGRADVSAQLTRADARQIYRYVSPQIDDKLRKWLQKSVQAGTASDVRVKLVGALADFPFADPKSGQFQLSGKAQGVALDYAAGWPGIDDMDLELRIDGARLAGDVTKGRIYTAQFARSKFDVPDLGATVPLLRIEGTVTGSAHDFIRYAASSPLEGGMQHAMEDVSVEGAGKLALKLELALGQPDANRISGTYTASDTRIALADGSPPIEHLNGQLLFTGHDFSAPGLTAEVLGLPARLSIATVDGHARVEGQGSVSFAALRAHYPKQALLTRASGTTDWKATVNAQPAGLAWTVESTLKGASIDLPPPAGKVASDALALRIERRVVDPAHDLVTASYGRVAKLAVERKLAPAGAVMERGLLSLGAGTAELQQRGFWMRGEVDAVDADAWLVVKEQLDAGAAADAVSLTGIDVGVGTLTAMGRLFRDLHIAATRSAGDWQIDLRGRELSGSARWEGVAADRPNGRLLAHLQRAVAPAAAPASAIAGPPARVDAPPAANPWPALDISADSFTVRNHDVGKLEFVAQPHDADWRIEKLTVTNDDGTLAANGWWRNTRSMQQTDLDVDLDIRDAGRYLARFGLPDAVRGAPGRLRGKLTWAGSPQDFDYPTLKGEFSVDTSRGQFLKLDPGIGKLLGVLSLQAFKRRLDGDYQDLFGEGFAFDEITGQVRIKDGVMQTDDLKIVGPSARVNITGSADLAHETQNLKVRVQPTLSASLSVGAAALMLANPIIGAAIGAGSLLAQKIMQDPIEQMFSQQYFVSGSWSDPQVSRRGAAAASAGPMDQGK